MMDGKQIGIGYVLQQDLSLQTKSFLQIGIEKQNIFIDTIISRKTLNSRTSYQQAKSLACKGDVVFLASLECLGRNAKEIEQEWRYFTEQVECDLVILDTPFLDTRCSASLDVSRIVLETLLGVARVDEKVRKYRQQEGIELAKKAGKYTGRQPIKVDKAEFSKWYKEVQAGERTARYAMKQLGLKNNTYYKLCKEYETKTGRFEE